MHHSAQDMSRCSHPYDAGNTPPSKSLYNWRVYAPLAAHSYYSLQEGLHAPSELAAAAAERGLPALALTDRHLLTGAVEFFQACQESGVQPLLGLQLDLDRGSLRLLAANGQGWSTLCRLSSALALRDAPASPCSTADLAPYGEDLLALAAGPVEDSPGLLGGLRDLFGDRLYLALQDPEDGPRLRSLAGGMGLPVVVAQPLYALRPESGRLLRTLRAVRLNRPIEALDPLPVPPPGLPGADEMRARYAGFEDALERTLEVAGRCRCDLPLGVAHMPAAPVPAGSSMAETLRRKAEAGALRRYGSVTPEIRARLDHELEVIASLGYEPVFLIVEQILEHARRTGVPTSSRGSAASSLVAHCLGITSPDPLRLNLYFERFLNPARRTPPDIDTDLCSRRRAGVIRHVFETYGAERVAMVGTINRYRPRSALGDVARAYGLPPAQAREMARRLPHAFWSRRQQAEPFAELSRAYPGALYRRVIEDARAVLDLPRHLSVHPGGLIVAPGAVTDLVPVMRSGSKGVVITQLDLESVEAFGLVKIDLLGIRGLTVLGDVAEFIQKDRPGDYATPLQVLESTPAEDQATADLVEHGQTIGCFQIESPGMRATLREIRARSEDDLTAALALYRPGPLTGGLKEAFVRRYKGQEPVEHLHPALAPLLADSYGVILYQEQVLRIAHELAGFSLAEADLLRRAMSHFDPGKRMGELRRKFVTEAQARRGVPAEVGERVWEMMAAFAGYGFPKAHAASYAQVAWRSAWCKAHFPAEFMAAVLANWGGYYSQRVYLSEARRLGLAIRPPHVNHAGRQFSAVRLGTGGGEAPALFMGLDQVRDLTRATIARILEARPFRSLEDFLARVDPRLVEAGNLVRVGALAGFGPIPAMLARLEGGWQAGQMSLFPPGGPEGEDWTVERKAAAQEALLGVGLEAHPLELLAGKVAAAGAVPTAEAAGRIGARLTVAGVRQTSRRGWTAEGRRTLALTLEDLSGMLEVAFPPAVSKRAEMLLRSNAPLVVTGTVALDEEHNEPYLRAERVEPLA